MARKVKDPSINLKISQEPAGNEAENVADSSPEAAELDAAIDALPEGSIAKLYRLEPNGERAFIDQSAPAAMDESRIAAHGAGKYIVVFRGPLGDGTNRVGYKKSRSVVIGESAARAAAATLAAPAANPTPNAGTAILDQLAGGMLVTMMQQMQQTSAMQAQQAREHSAAMMALISKMGERPPTDPILTTLLTTVLSGRADPIEQATKIAEIASRGGGAKGGTSDVLAALELVEKIREMGGSGGDKADKGWTGIFRELAPLVLGKGQAAPQQPVAVVEPNATVPQVTGGEPPQDQRMLEYLTPIQPFYSRILESAQVGTSADIAADYFVSFVPGGHVPILLGILDRPSVVTDIVSQSPAFKPYEVWLTAFVNEMRSALRGEDAGDGDDDDAGDGG